MCTILITNPPKVQSELPMNGLNALKSAAEPAFDIVRHKTEQGQLELSPAKDPREAWLLEEKLSDDRWGLRSRGSLFRVCVTLVNVRSKVYAWRFRE